MSILNGVFIVVFTILLFKIAADINGGDGGEAVETIKNMVKSIIGYGIAAVVIKLTSLILS